MAAKKKNLALPHFKHGAVKIQVKPSVSTEQDPHSYQVPTDAQLTLSWEAVHAVSVHVSGHGSQPPSGSLQIPANDKTYTLVAHSERGVLSSPYRIAVHTHEPGASVSGHYDVSSPVTRSGPALWLHAGGAEEKWRWEVRGRADAWEPIASGPFKDGKVTFAELRDIPGAMRINITCQPADNRFAKKKASLIDDGGHYTVCHAASDGTPDPKRLVIAGQLGDGQPDVLRHIPYIGSDDLAITLKPWNDTNREGAGFKYIKHFFVLMLENRSFDHMLGRNPELREVDGTLNPDAKNTTRNDCRNTTYTTDKTNQLKKDSFELAGDGAPNALVVDPGHEFTHVHFGLKGWPEGGVEWEQANVITSELSMDGFIAAYHNRLSPRTPKQGQWDVDGWNTHKTLVEHDPMLAALEKKGFKRDALQDVAKLVMKGYGPKEIAALVPNLHNFARKYAVCDRWFSSLPGPTWPNRFFVHCGTSGGMDDSPHSPVWHEIVSHYDMMNIYDLVAETKDDKSGQPGIWNCFSQDSLLPQMHALKLHTWNNPENVLNPFSKAPKFCNQFHTGDSNFSTLRKVLEEDYGKHPFSVTFLEPDYGKEVGGSVVTSFVGGTSQHPSSGVKDGDKMIGRVVEVLQSEPEIWNACALFVCYDEHGGFYDHVVPPAAIPPGETQTTGKKPFSKSALRETREAANEKSPVPEAFDFDRLGVRVPGVIISPRIPAGVTDHTIYDHTSVPKTIRKAFQIRTPLSDREMYANDFSHLFTLETPRED